MRAIAQAVAEPRLRWTVGLYDTFDATMAGRLEDAESIATANLDLGLQIGVPDAFAFFAAQLFVIASDGGRAEELLPVIEQAMNDNPAMLPFKLAYGIICAGVGRDDVARDVLREGLATRFSEISVDNVWMTSVIGYAVLAIDLGDAEAAAYLRPIIEPFSADVAFNGVTSQGPVATYLGRLASLLGDHEAAEEYLLAALDTATAFGWKYHRATTLFSLAQTRYRQNGSLDRESEAWLSEASDLCRIGGFRSWIPQIDALAGVSPR
jgi:tetratricopeptide (TPR) repeat protein